MYERTFGLREAPFNNTPNPRFFFATPEHEEALACLEYVVREAKGFAVLTGDAGTGKTLVSRLLISRLGSTVSVATLHQGCSSPRELLEHLCTELGLDVEPSAGRGAMLKALRDLLVSEYAANRSVVVIVDEAQSLPIECFEQIRLVGNLDAENAKLLQVVLLGQPALHTTLRSAHLRQLRQRIFRGFNLGPLSEEQTGAYIRHRLKVAGATRDDIFSDDAAERLFRFTGGLPRMINTACDNALLDAYAADRLTIDADFMQDVLERIELPVIGAGASDASPRPGAYERTGEARRRAGRAERGLRRHAESMRPQEESAQPYAESRSSYAGPSQTQAAVDTESTRLLAQLASRIEHIELRAGQLADIESRLTTLVRSAQTSTLSQPRRAAPIVPPPAKFVAATRENRRSLLRMASIVQGVVRHMRTLSKQIQESKETPAPTRPSAPTAAARRSTHRSSTLPARTDQSGRDSHRRSAGAIQTAFHDLSLDGFGSSSDDARACSRVAQAHAPQDNDGQQSLGVVVSADRLRRDVETLIPLAAPFLSAPARMPDTHKPPTLDTSPARRVTQAARDETDEASLLGSLNSILDLMQSA